jgi:hypothetical protein
MSAPKVGLKKMVSSRRAIHPWQHPHVIEVIDQSLPWG